MTMQGECPKGVSKKKRTLRRHLRGGLHAIRSIERKGNLGKSRVGRERNLALMENAGETNMETFVKRERQEKCPEGGKRKNRRMTVQLQGKHLRAQT